MKKILAFAGSNSPTSINHQLILNVSRRISEHEVEVIKLSDYEFPMFSIVREKGGIPQNIQFLYENCLLYTSPSPRDRTRSRMPSSA